MGRAKVLIGRCERGVCRGMEAGWRGLNRGMVGVRAGCAACDKSCDFLNWRAGHSPFIGVEVSSARKAVALNLQKGTNGARVGADDCCNAY